MPTTPTTTDADEPAGPAPATPAGEQLALVNVGDSRTYLLRHGRLRRVTVDHSYVQELVATGHITDDEARTHPRRNIVTRALGHRPQRARRRLDAARSCAATASCCAATASSTRCATTRSSTSSRRIDDPQAAADELVALANAQGGRDNITVVVVDVVEGAEPPDPDSELDLEPAWDDGTSESTWAVDDPDAEATEFEDLAALVSGDEPAPSTAPTADDATAPAARPTAATVRCTDGDPGRRRATGDPPPQAPPDRLPRRRSACSPCSCWRSSSPRRGPAGASSSPSTTPTSSSSTAARPTASCGSIRPWKHRPSSTAAPLDDDSIERVEREPRFDSRRAAERFVAEQLETTTTTSTTTTTTTTTTVPATTTPPTTTAP